MYTEKDLEILIDMLAGSKDRIVKKLLNYTTFQSYFEHIKGNSADEKLRGFIFQSFYEYSAEDPNVDWYAFVFEKPLDDMPLYVNYTDLRKVLAVWRLSIAQ
jgi:hypothetical protein